MKSAVKWSTSERAAVGEPPKEQSKAPSAEGRGSSGLCRTQVPRGRRGLAPKGATRGSGRSYPPPASGLLISRIPLCSKGAHTLQERSGPLSLAGGRGLFGRRHSFLSARSLVSRVRPTSSSARLRSQRLADQSYVRRLLFGPEGGVMRPKARQLRKAGRGLYPKGTEKERYSRRFPPSYVRPLVASSRRQAHDPSESGRGWPVTRGASSMGTADQFPFPASRPHSQI